MRAHRTNSWRCVVFGAAAGLLLLTLGEQSSATPRRALREMYAATGASQPPKLEKGRSRRTAVPQQSAGRRRQLHPITSPTSRFFAPGAAKRAAKQPRSHSSVRVRHCRESGLPVFVKGVPAGTGGIAPLAKGCGASAVQRAAAAYLRSLAPILGVANPDSAFRVRKIHRDGLGQVHARLTQRIGGIPVDGSDAYVHFKDGKPHVFNGRYTRSSWTETKPRISSEGAVAIVVDDLSSRTRFDHAFQRENGLGYGGPEAELVLSDPSGALSRLRLVWKVTILPSFRERWIYHVDALDGAILHRINTTRMAGTTGTGADLMGITRSFGVYEKFGTYYMVDCGKPMYDGGSELIMPEYGSGVIRTFDYRGEAQTGECVLVQSNDKDTWDPALVSAHAYAGMTYDYLYDTFGRNSLDDDGRTIRLFVNLGGDEGGAYDNAFFNGYGVYFGNGETRHNWARALDIVAHEMGHGVVQYTANLKYENQSGAINEAYADFFAMMVDRDDWQFGEDVVKDGLPIRDLADPNQGGTEWIDDGWQPKHMDEYLNIEWDYGGVHFNNGIPCHALYLMSEEIGKDKVEKIWYRALVTYLTRSSQFVDLRLALIQSAQDLHGAGSAEEAATANAFHQVGIGEGVATDTDRDLPDHPGQDAIVYYDNDPSVEHTLCIADKDFTEVVPISTQAVFHRVSMTDDGSEGYYVSAPDMILMGFEFENDTLFEVVVDDTHEYGSVAVSKDGWRLAATVVGIDAAIWVHDFESGRDTVFSLYNPATCNGTSTGDIQFAFSMEWDYSGEHLIFDAFNEVQTTGSTAATYEYWDVGILHAWDNEGATFGSGDIQKLYASLPPGVSLGNPSFAKKSGNVIAFDMYDMRDTSCLVVTRNVETGDEGIIGLASMGMDDNWGYPSFSLDDRTLIFTYWSSSDTTPNLMAVPLDSTAMATAGDVSVKKVNAVAPTWFGLGARDIGVVHGPGANSLRGPALDYRRLARATEFQFVLPAAGRYLLRVYGVDGALVFKRSGSAVAGANRLVWDNTSTAGRPVASGHYVAEIRGPNVRSTRRFVLSR